MALTIKIHLVIGIYKELVETFYSEPSDPYDYAGSLSQVRKMNQNHRPAKILSFKEKKKDIRSFMFIKRGEEVVSATTSGRSHVEVTENVEICDESGNYIVLRNLCFFLGHLN